MKFNAVPKRIGYLSVTVILVLEHMLDNSCNCLLFCLLVLSLGCLGQLIQILSW